jgi:formate-dependent nitrite reductase membrane component NrfD
MLAPIVLSVGMTFLFLDLEHKLFVYRFYTSFQVTSPMSWGAWILIVVYPFSILQILSTVRSGYASLASTIDRLTIGRLIVDWCERYRTEIALAVIPFAVALGIYTGILLSAFGARPFWNSGVLGLLFLVSGMSTAAALVVLLARQRSEKDLFTRIDLVLIMAEIALVALSLISLASGSGQHIDALQSVMGGSYTLAFWVLFVGIGLLIPMLLEILEISGISKSMAMLAPVLVLIGGYALRQVVMDAGQESTWTNYSTQFNSELLQRLPNSK